jgi:hypothetical protein
MGPRRDSFRFDPRWLPPAIGTDGAALPVPPEESALFGPEASQTEPAATDSGLALEEMFSAGCRVCPLCGLIVARDGRCVR